ncbi:MAG: nickel-dependent lactate racemase [Methylobacteriaceae bacterium]|jgi:hypothetical protein|nr:nickel-dependent lactate racemase [Methylobacteriaceae bacterium]
MRPGYARLVDDFPIPPVALVRQSFAAMDVSDVQAALRQALSTPCTGAVKPGMSIAVTAGSRGFAQFVPVLKGLVEFIRERGAHPFVVPAMGSHGGATAEGQRKVLEHLGVTESTIGCPIRSSMETVEVGVLENGMSVRIDKLAHEADGIVLYNRIKPHTGFRAPLESGLAKMLTIGLGKQSGAENCHLWGFGHMGHLVEEMAVVKLKTCKVLFGVGTIENAYDRLSRIVVAAPQSLIAEEKEFLKIAMGNMPRLPIGPLDEPLATGPLDVLIIDYVGKEFSGACMDTNITGRPSSPAMSGGPDIKRIAVLDITDKSAGNANGVARADVITDKLFNKFDREAVYMNAVTSGLLCAASIPLSMPDDKSAIQAAVKTCETRTPDAVRMLRIPNTLHLEYLYASEAMLPELEERPGIEILSRPAPMRFDAAGNLIDPWPPNHSIAQSS